MRYSPTPIRDTKSFLKKNAQYPQYHSVFWAVLFYINLFVTVYIFREGSRRVNFNLYDFLTENFEFPVKGQLSYIKSSVKYAMIGTGLTNLLHYIYSICFPRLFINLNLYLQLIVSVVGGFFSLFAYNNYESSFAIFLGTKIFAIFLIIFGIYKFICQRKIAKISGYVMKASNLILLKHPSLFLIEIFETLLVVAITLLFSIEYYAISSLSDNLWSYSYLYFYTGFSYYWITHTIYYVSYMTVSCIAGYDFYLHNSSFMPKSIVFFAFKRAITQQFGCAAYGGFVIAIIEVLKMMIKVIRQDDKKEKKSVLAVVDIIRYCIYYLLNCILNIIETYLQYITRHALIYCAIYDMPFSDATSRWHRKDFNSKIDKLFGQVMINDALLVSYIVSGLIVLGIFYLFFANEVEQLEETLVIAAILLFSVYFISSSLVKTAVDTIFVCYLEYPEKLQKRFGDLYKEMNKISYQI